MTKEQITKAIHDWLRDDNAMVGPERVAVGHNFDMLVDRIMALQSEGADRDAVLEEAAMICDNRAAFAKFGDVYSQHTAMALAGCIRALKNGGK